jgi:hypothetical protein
MTFWTDFMFQKVINLYYFIILIKSSIHLILPLANNMDRQSGSNKCHQFDPYPACLAVKLATTGRTLHTPTTSSSLNTTAASSRTIALAGTSAIVIVVAANHVGECL